MRGLSRISAMGGVPVNRAEAEFAALSARLGDQYEQGAEVVVVAPAGYVRGLDPPAVPAGDR